MKIRMKIGVAGAFHHLPDGVRVGDIVDVEPDEEAARYCELGYADPVRSHHKAEEHAVPGDSDEERAVVEPVYGETHPPEDVAVPATKRGRPRKDA